MADTSIILTPDEIYSVAIHEAGHLVVRYLLYGNIDTIDSVSVGPRSGSLGRNCENVAKKSEEFENALDTIEEFTKVGGYAYKECCYSLAGCIADKVYEKLDCIPYQNSDEDMLSLYSFLGQYLNSDEINKVVEKAVPDTEVIVSSNFSIIRQVADSLTGAPDKKLEKSELLLLLDNLHNRTV